MYEYNICNYADATLFTKQCHALEQNIPHIKTEELYEDVDGTKVQKYSHPNGSVIVKNDARVDALYVIADFDLLPYFSSSN